MTGRITSAPVQRFSRNVAGRDFVVGDIHGAFSLVWDAMQKAHFNPPCDRLFAVGDLIDRGDDSARVARFLALPYVHSVRGNHEDFMIELHEDGPPDQEVLRYVAGVQGMGWWLSTADSLRQDILAAIRALPLAIEIETERGSVGLIHADVPAGMAWPEFLAALERGDPKTIETCLESRTRVESGDRRGVPGVGRLFVGHTPQRGGPGRLGNVIAIDTGAIFGLKSAGEGPGHLSMARMDMTTEALLAPRAPIDLISLRDEPVIPSGPFGHYAHSPATPRG